MALLVVYARQDDPVFVAASVSGDTFQNDGETELLITNPGPSSTTIIAVATRKCGHGFLDNWIEVIPPGSLFRFGPFLPSRFNDPNNILTIGFTSVVGVSLAAQRLK